MNKKVILTDTGKLGIKVEIVDSGVPGKTPDHRWVEDTALQFQNPDGSWGEIIELGTTENLKYSDMKDKPVMNGFEIHGEFELEDVGIQPIENEDIKKLI